MNFEYAFGLSSVRESGLYLAFAAAPCGRPDYEYWSLDRQAESRGPTWARSSQVVKFTHRGHRMLSIIRTFLPFKLVDLPRLASQITGPDAFK